MARTRKPQPFQNKTLSIDQDDFKRGLVLLEDDSLAPFGSARKILNAVISDRGGITTRPGTALIGEYNEAGGVAGGLFNFKKSDGATEILLRPYDDRLEYFFDDNWHLLKEGFEPDQEFGFVSSIVNTETDDYVYFSNAKDEYQRWNGAVTRLVGAASSSTIVVDVESTLKPNVYFSGTATANSTTTVTVAGAGWADSMWVNFYIHFPDTKEVRAIDANSSTVITFSEGLDGPPGNIDFEVRNLAFPRAGNLIYDETIAEYTDIMRSDQFPVATPHDADEGTPVTVVPEVFIGAPRGNRLENLLGRVLVGGNKQAVARDAAGNLQGTDNASTVFVSKILDPKDFSFNPTRQAGEGDILTIAYGGGPITDIKAQEEFAYIYKKDYIEALRYTNDSDDIAVRQPLKAGVGSVAKVVKGRDDHFFMTVDKQLTSIGRVASKDLVPQTENIGLPIKRLLDEYDHTKFNGIEYRNRILTCHKTSSDDVTNNVILIWNRATKSFEGIWALPAGGFEIKNDQLFYVESSGANVWRMFEEQKADTRGDFENRLPFTTEWQSNFFNLLPVKGNTQALNSIAAEGYITPNTTLRFAVYADFASDPVLEFDFTGTEAATITSSDFNVFLGGEPLAVDPLASIEDPTDDGRRRFSFLFYFPWLYGQYFSTGLKSEGVEQDWEIVRLTLGLRESASALRKGIKNQ